MDAFPEHAPHHGRDIWKVVDEYNTTRLLFSFRFRHARSWLGLGEMYGLEIVFEQLSISSYSILDFQENNIEQFPAGYSIWTPLKTPWSTSTHGIVRQNRIALSGNGEGDLNRLVG